MEQPRVTKKNHGVRDFVQACRPENCNLQPVTSFLVRRSCLVLNRDMSGRILLVSGPPASGKSTIARPLARALGFALLTKDDIKESLFTSLNGPAGDVDFSRRLSAAAMDLLWALAPHCPRVVLEANFRTRDPHERERVRALIAAPDTQLVEVCCTLPLPEAARRFSERARLQRRHPAHAVQEMSAEQLAVYEVPFALGPVITVDTQRPVEIPALVQQVRDAFNEKPTSSAQLAPGHLK